MIGNKGLPDFSRFRIQNIMNQQPSQNASFGGDGDIFSTFMSTIFPLIQQRQRAKQLLEDQRLRSQQSFDLTSKQNILNSQQGFEAIENQKNRDLQLRLAEPKLNPPMQTVFDPGITPYQQAQLALQKERLNIGSVQDREKLQLEGQKAEETARKNKALEESRTKETERKTQADKARADVANKRAEIAGIQVSNQMPEELKLRLQAALRVEEQKLQGSQDIEEIKLRGTIQEKLAELEGKRKTEAASTAAENARKLVILRAEEQRKLPSQQRVEFTNKINHLRLTRPELAQYLETDPNTGDITVNTDDISKEELAELTKILGQSREPETGKEKPPPPGMKPGGKWVETKWGSTYKEPS